MTKLKYMNKIEIFLFLIHFSNKIIQCCEYGYIGPNCDIECGLSYPKPIPKIVGGIEAPRYYILINFCFINCQ